MVKKIDRKLYQGMLYSFLYLMARSNIILNVGTCAHFESCSKVSHLNVVKIIFNYLKGKIEFGLWYPQV